jgi:hypothetical protein
MSFDLTVYHNVDSRFFEFTPGDMLKPTDRLARIIKLVDLPDTLLVDVDKTLEMIFAQLNVGEPEQQWAQAVKMAGHRSLSVGDVIQLGEMAYAVANSGFKPVSIDARQIINNRPPDVSIAVDMDLPE